MFHFFFFKQKTAYEMRISDWSSDVCSSDLRYRPGTNMRAWVFIILRNVFLSQKRRDRFKGEWNQEIADRTLCTPANQEKQLQLADLQRALTTLPPAQREALKIGRASCRERVCQYVKISWVAGSLKKK